MPKREPDSYFLSVFGKVSGTRASDRLSCNRYQAHYTSTGSTFIACAILIAVNRNYSVDPRACSRNVHSESKANHKVHFRIRHFPLYAALIRTFGFQFVLRNCMQMSRSKNLSFCHRTKAIRSAHTSNIYSSV